MYTTYNKLMLVTATLLLTIYTPAQPFFFCSPKMVSKKTVYYSHPYCCFDKKIVYYDTEFDDDGEAYLIKKYSYKPCSACCHKKLYKKSFYAHAKPRPFFGFNVGFNSCHRDPAIGFSFGLS